MCCFEGMKAYQGADGRMRLFRPELNMARLRRSGRRLQLADFEPQELLGCLKQLLLVDRSWLPAREGYSIYIRPFMFSSAHALGVAKPTRSTISILLSPVGPYFPTGLKPISLFVDEHHRRAWPGGVGDYKVGGNYAPTIQPQVAAGQAHGVPQVLYTFKESHEHPDHAEFEECGSMNMFFYLQQPDGRRELVTPALSGTILPGITRDSILALAAQWGECEVAERPVTIAEVRAAAHEGRLLEMFGSGTACIVQPVGSLVR
jgi:branched-chain amino acid aminotransferase